MRNRPLTACTYLTKGGVGKTTSAAHIGVAASQQHGLDVLLIDLAGQQNDLATQFGLDVNDIDAPISAAFGDQWETIVTGIDDLLNRMTYDTGEGPDLIPADSGLGGADSNLSNVPLEDRFDRLDEFLDDLVAGEYDLVIFDLPGKEDNITLNGLAAAGNVIAPLKPGEFERDQLETLESDFERMAGEQSHPVNPDLSLLIPTMVDSQTNLSSDFVAELREDYPDRVAPPVAKSQSISNQQRDGRTLFAVPDDELYATGKRAREAYSTLTDALLDTIDA